MITHVILGTFTLVVSAFAQSSSDFDPTFDKTPSLWSTEVAQTNEELLDSASSALRKGVSMLDSAFYRFPDSDERDTFDFLGVLANFDYVTKQKTFESLANYIRWSLIGGAVTPSKWQVKDYLRYGYAAARAYAAYGDKEALGAAQDNWVKMKRYTITGQNFVSESDSVKNFKVLTECDSQSMKGATFREVDVNGTDIGIFETGLYFLYVLLSSFSAQLSQHVGLRLSASLGEATQDDQYITEALQSLNFINSHLNIVTKYGFNQRAESQAPQNSFNESSIGMLLEGICRLPNANATLFEQVVESIFKLTLGTWPSPTGVVPNVPMNNGGEYGGGMYLVRGLSEAYRRVKAQSMPLRSDLVQFVKTFLGVQYNAVRGQNPGGSNVYGSSWLGVPTSSFDPAGQAAAAQVLIDGIEVFATNDSGMSDPTSPSPPSKSKQIGAIIGGVVGGVVVLLILGLLWLLFARRRRRKYEEREKPPVDLHYDLDPSYEVTPFMSQTVTQITPSSKSLHNDKSHTSSSPQHKIRPVRVAEGADHSPSPPEQPQSVSADTESPQASRTRTEHTVTLDGVPSQEVAEMVRALYHRMWRPDRNERPPAYEQDHNQAK
ncbi:hypothetical protein VNI00_017031 [Paramarasmius palmivorus]|uniref:Uncharacterized protein n=1 Tax=Paramarasmius palmivorus TaxID=297713 RepID=A0AAW0BAM3_9AGAR